MNVRISCPRCGKMLMEDEDFIEDGTRYIEIKCISCPFIVYKDYNEWKKRLAAVMARRN